ncbi:MAG: DUF4373 domain-containing protein [Dehalococcoidia bacterium]|nr:DUF4373 domain-containing protein [Dehalococcoidia bacterium]
MARPQKDTVDYFPHDAKASSGDTITALEGQFGNDGYAFWFKLLEHLASSEGHYIDCGNTKKWQLILARARVKHETGVEMMKLLVEMGAIDRGLWAQGIIWCQNLVDNVAEVYQNRRRPIPLRPVVMPVSTPNNPKGKKEFLPVVMPLLQVTTVDNSITTPINSITTPESTQSKVEYSKEKESKVEKSREEERKEEVSLSLEQVIEVYEKNICLPGTIINEEIENQLKFAVQQFSAPWVIDAIKEAVIANNPTLKYIGGILRTWQKEEKHTTSLLSQE